MPRSPESPTTRPNPWLRSAALAVFAVLALGPLFIMGLRLVDAPEEVTRLLNDRTVDLLGRTVALGLATATIALALGAPFGFLVARTNVLGARLLRPLGVVPILIPPIMLAMTWTMVLPLRGPVMCALILGVSTYPLVALFTARAAERVDARREEAAKLVGGLPAVLRMEAPLLAVPALGGAVLAFVVAINEFALPDYVSSVGKKFNVYAGEVFSTWQVDGNEPRAVATALPLVVLTLLILGPVLALRGRRRSDTIDDRFEHPAPLDLGRLRWPATLFCVLVVSVGALVPIGRLVYESGGGSRVFSGVSIRRSNWNQGGGAAPSTPMAPTGQTLTAAGSPAPVDEAKVNAAREAALASAQAAALAASGITASAPAANSTNPAVARRRSVNATAPEALAAKEAAEAGDDSDLFGGFADFRVNFRKAFQRALDLSRESILSSLLFAIFAATLSVPIALVLGHSIARGRLGVLVEWLILVPLAVPATLFGIGTIVLWNHELTAGIYESGALVGLLFAGRFLAIPTLICAGAVRSFDPRLEESAALAGAGPVRRLATIVAPGVWTSLVGAWVVTFALSVRELDAAVLVPAANDTAMFRVFNAVHFGRDDFVSALSLLVIFAILLPGLVWSLLSPTKLRVLP